jgi:hypothetical protein
VVTITKIFEPDDDGVMVAVIPESVSLSLLIVVSLEVFAETTCNTFPPPAGAAHLRPVVSVESATMLQLGKGIVLGSAQSCANVLDKRIIPILNCELWN